MEAFLRSLPGRVPEVPAAILVISAHWETSGFHLTGHARPPLIYDYYGFPPETYALRYEVPGSPAVAAEAAALLQGRGLPVQIDAHRGLDHGVFVPLKVAFPEASVPVLEMSVDRGLDPALHLAAGRALAPLRDRGVLMIGSGMSFHNLRGFGDQRFTHPSQTFDRWLTSTVEQSGDDRAQRLGRWHEAPGGFESHPEAEHLIPLMVAAGTSDRPGERIYSDVVLGAAVSGYRFA